MTRRTTALALAACLALAATAHGPDGAEAAPYVVKQCNDATADTDFGFQSYINGNIKNGGTTCGNYALYTLANPNVTYSHGTWGGFTAYAPGGVDIVGFSANVWTLYNNYSNDFRGYDLVFTGDACRPPTCSPRSTFLEESYANTWSAGPRPVGWNGGGGPARWVFLGFRCLNQATAACAHPGLDMRLRFRDVTFTMDDPTPPVARTIGGSITWPGWRRGREELVISATDDGGGVGAMVPTVDRGTNPPGVGGACSRAGGYFTRMVPCALSHSGAVPVDTTTIADGTRTLSLYAFDAAGTPSAPISMTVRVDNEPPPAPSAPAVVGGSGWRRSNDFSIAWDNPAEADRAPITRSHWRACPVGGGGACVEGDGAASRATGISLPRAGEWDAKVWVEDAAGNGAAGDARRKESAAVRLRYDPDPAQVSFEAPDADHPLRVAARATDMSGLAAGELELRRAGEDAWRGVPTVRDGDALVGEVPDERLPDGVYDLRARALDRAGNETIATQPAARRLPLRLATAVTARVVKRGRRRCARARVRAKRRAARRCRTATRLARGVRARYGRTVLVSATVRAARGEPLPGAPLTVAFEEGAGGGAAKVADLRADGEGRVLYRARAARSGTIPLRYGGTRHTRGAVGAVRVSVPAPVTIRPRRRLVFNGEEATFLGRIRGLEAAGKLVEVQARVGREWRVFRTTHTRRGGRWSATYRFSAVTSRRARLTFRACAPVERSFAYARGCSRKTTIVVRPL